MSYKKAGVDEGRAASWVDKIAGLTKASSPKQMRSRIGDYAAVYELSPDHWVATACDGVGTKLLWTLEGLGSAEQLAQDLLAMNANDVLCVGAHPVLFLDYLALGNPKLLDEGQLLSKFIAALSKVCSDNDQILAGGETAQMPDLYEGSHFDLAGFSVGFSKASEYFDIEKVEIGDEIWGWPSSGPHANGFSWIRKSFDIKKDAEFIREHLMKPTELYIRPFQKLRAELNSMGAASTLRTAYHMTGTGVLNLLRKQPESWNLGFDLDQWPSEDPLWVKELIRRNPESRPEEFFKTFNMGYGFCIVFDKKFAKDSESRLRSHGLKKLGKVIQERTVKVRGLAIEKADD